MLYKSDMLLRPFWQKIIKTPWKLGIGLILLWGIPRFLVVLQANQSGNYQWVSLIFISMWITPWLLLSSTGRQKMGIGQVRRPIWLLYGFGLGVMACSMLYGIAHWLYADTISNWFVYISRSYSNLPVDLSKSDKLIYFFIYAAISMIFSPIGEELFYRGVIHECLATRWSDRIASRMDGAAFALTHLAHFGIVYQSGQWNFLFIPAILWVVLLFFTCRLFSVSRQQSGSISGAILAHAGFNLAMSYFIFFHVL